MPAHRLGIRGLGPPRPCPAILGIFSAWHPLSESCIYSKRERYSRYSKTASSAFLGHPGESPCGRVYVMTTVRSTAGINKRRTPERRTDKSCPPRRCSRSFRRRWPAISRLIARFVISLGTKEGHQLPPWVGQPERHRGAALPDGSAIKGQGIPASPSSISGIPQMQIPPWLWVRRASVPLVYHRYGHLCQGQV